MKPHAELPEHRKAATIFNATLDVASRRVAHYLDGDSGAPSEIKRNTMKQLITFALGLIAFLVPCARAAVSTGPLTNAANGHVYYLLSTNSWTRAEKEAVSLGGHLVTINDEAEQTWVYSKFGSNEVWIGLSDREVEGTFQWVSGETSTYRNWDPGEPNNAISGNNNQDYVHIYSNTNSIVSRRGKWDDRSETEAFALGFKGVVEVIPEIVAQAVMFTAVQIAWPTQTTNSYQIQWSSLLNTNDWFNLGSPIQGTGSTNYYFDSTRGVNKKFYRVLTLQP